MDLHIVGAEPTDIERAAVDALLGAPASGWDGGARVAARDGRVARGGRPAALERRDLLLPAFHAVQDRVGWVSRGALNYICTRLLVPPAEAWGVLTFYHLFATAPRPATVVHVCDDIACRAHGVEGLCQRLEAALGPSGQGAWQRSPCLGQCDRAPAALVTRAGDPPERYVIRPVRVDDVLAAARDHAVDDDRARAARAVSLAVGVPHPHDSVRPGASVDARLAELRGHVPQAGGSGLTLLRRIGIVDPASLDAYVAAGGYRALTRAIDLGPAGVIAEVTAAKLMGRGGAAFPTGRKWDAVAKEPARPHFVVCNADESEPGTFKDRVLMAGDPFTLVEAMTICGLATHATQGYIYIRGEYPGCEARLADAIVQARAAGLLGLDVMGSGHAFDLEIRRGAGAYICGEETALFNSLEGKRGEPRSKPPFPAQAGLFGKPTVVNNVETLANIPDILLEGGEAWARTGTPASTGTRLFCVSGHVARPGLYELPFGRTLGDVLDLAGGVAGGRALQAILLGGAAGVFVGPESLGLRLTFEDVRAANATLGSGVVMVFDDRASIPDMLGRMAAFFEHESCGQCVPCRVGTVRQREWLARVSARADGRPAAATAEELAVLTELGQAMRDASICGLGQTASSAVESAIQRLHLFRPSGGAS